MNFQKGETVTYFRATTPAMKMDAVFVDQNKTRARITITDRRGARTIAVPMESLERKGVAPAIPHGFTPELGITGLR